MNAIVIVNSCSNPYRAKAPISFCAFQSSATSANHKTQNMMTLQWKRQFLLHPLLHTMTYFIVLFSGIYLFKVSIGNMRTMCEICSKLAIVSLLLTSNRFYKLLWCFRAEKLPIEINWNTNTQACFVNFVLDFLTQESPKLFSKGNVILEESQTVVPQR